MAIGGRPGLGQRVFVHCRSTEFSRKTIHQVSIVIVEDVTTELETKVNADANGKEVQQLDRWGEPVYEILKKKVTDANGKVEGK